MKKPIMRMFASCLNKCSYFFKKSKGIATLSQGYLIAVIKTLLVDIKDHGIVPALDNSFNIATNFSNLLTYIVIFVLLIRAMLLRYSATSVADSQLAAIFRNNIDPIFHPHLQEGLGWGTNITVLCCSNTSSWWKTNDLRFRVDPREYQLSELCSNDPTLELLETEKRYKEYLTTEFPQYFSRNSDRYMLTNRHLSTSDDYGLIIELRKTKWSMLRFFWDKLLTDEGRKRYISDFFKKGIIFTPNSFCLHLIILTKNNKVFITQNSPAKKSDKPSTWAVSIGEQIDFKDIQNLRTCIHKRLSKV